MQFRNLYLILGLSSLVLTLPTSYDVVWNEPSQANGSASSMPLGGGDVGLNVWVENGTILFYIAKSGTFDENNSLLKLGRVRLTLQPNPFSLNADSFEQRLALNDGCVQLTGTNATIVRMWVDVFNPIVHVDVSSDAQVQMWASLESWRSEDHEMSTSEKSQCSWQSIPNITAYTRKDEISFFNNGVLSHHRNGDSTVFDATVKEEGMEQYRDRMYNPLLGNTFGLYMVSNDLQPGNVTSGHYVNTKYQSWNLVSSATRNTYNLTIAVHQNQTSSVAEWQTQLEEIVQNASSDTSPTMDWWHSFWNRSYILINTNASASDVGFQVGKNYQLMRYMFACNAYGDWPTRFNGGLFTFDPYFVESAQNFTPDFRLWSGGTFTAQNQRLVYWPMLKAGDIDMMRPQFEFYRRITETARLRGLEYYGINHAWFVEQIDNFGLPQIFQFNADICRLNLTRPDSFPAGVEFNRWLTWEMDTSLEFAQMILDAHSFGGLEISPYMNFIESQLIWFDEFYQQQQQARDVFSLTGTAGNESLVIYPGSGAETYKDAYNPSSTIAALYAVTSNLLRSNVSTNLANATFYRSLLSRIPEVPLRTISNRTMIAPAQAYSRIQNVEIPQLYPVFPWSLYGLGQPNLTHAINTYLYDPETQDFHDYKGWKQDGIWAARLGLTGAAKNITSLKLGDSQDYRFPAFYGPNFDWSPDMNHGGSAMIGLQEMLLQTFANNTRQIRVAPSWPAEWDVSFKLHAPFETIVEGEVRGGKIVGSVDGLNVTPEERAVDIVVGREGL